MALEKDRAFARHLNDVDVSAPVLGVEKEFVLMLTK